MVIGPGVNFPDGNTCSGLIQVASAQFDIAEVCPSLPRRNARRRTAWVRQTQLHVGRSVLQTWRRAGALIEENPVTAQVRDGFAEIVEVHRLDDVAVDALVRSSALM